MSESAGPTVGDGDSPFPAAYGPVGSGGGEGSDAPARPVRAPRTRSARTATADPADGTSRRRARPSAQADEFEQIDAEAVPVPRPRRPMSAASRRTAPVLPPGPPPAEPPPTEVPPTAAGPAVDPASVLGSRGDTADPLDPTPGDDPAAGDWAAPDRPVRPQLRNRVSRPQPQPTDSGEWAAATPSDVLAREVARQYAPDSEISLGRERRWGRRRVTVLRTRVDRRMVRRIDTWTVFKMSFFFYLLLLVIVLLAGVVTWFVAQRIGFVGDIQKSVRSLADDRSFILHGGPVLEYAALGGVVLAVAGTLLNTIGAMLYNLLSDLVGGIQTIVVTEPD